MLQLLIGTDLPFMRYRRFAYAFSSALVLATVVWLVAHGGPRYSVDFTGGTLLQIRLSQPVPADQVRKALDAGGFQGIELQQMTSEGNSEFLLRIGQAEQLVELVETGQAVAHLPSPIVPVRGIVALVEKRADLLTPRGDARHRRRGLQRPAEQRLRRPPGGDARTLPHHPQVWQ